MHRNGLLRALHLQKPRRLSDSTRTLANSILVGRLATGYSSALFGATSILYLDPPYPSGAAPKCTNSPLIQSGVGTMAVD